jgi:hypothetical protein
MLKTLKINDFLGLIVDLHYKIWRDSEKRIMLEICLETAEATGDCEQVGKHSSKFGEL